MGRHYGLEALRGIAALAVLWGHLCERFDHAGLFSLLSGKTYLAVDLFFIISGFVLARTYERAMPATTDFAVLRFRRLWAPVAAGSALMVGLFLWGGMSWQDGALLLVAGLALMPGPAMAFAANPPAWSIFFELVANVLHAALLVKLRKLGLASVFVGAVVVLGQGSQIAGLDLGLHELFWWGFARVIASYTLGVLLYRLNGERTWLAARWAWPLVIAYPLALALFPNGPAPLAEMLFAFIAHPLLVLGVLAMPNRRAAVWLGTFSFPLYALHAPLMIAGQQLFGTWPLVLLISVAGSAVLGLLVDPRWRRLMLGTIRPAPVPANLATIPA
ncbi:MAG: acyltransferase [Pseudomonadota bacterium]